MIKIKNNKAFSSFEIIICVFIISLFANLAFLKYKDFKEKRDIEEAKTKIVETFYTTSIRSLTKHSRISINIDFQKKELIVTELYPQTIKKIQLPKNLKYFHTHKSKQRSFKVFLTKNGNIAESFSIYIFNLKNKVRYRISFYGFDKCRFLKINTYKKRDNKEIYLSEISSYHDLTNEDRESFYIDWRKE